jgi:uncharacterized protein (DUF885 family)
MKMAATMACACAAVIAGVATTAIANQPAASPVPPPANDAAGRFHALYTREWNWRKAQFADDEDRRQETMDHLPKVDKATQAEREKYWVEVRSELSAIDENALNAEDQVNYEVYGEQIDSLLADQRQLEWQMPFNSDSAFWSNLGFTARHPIMTEENYRHYLAQLKDIPRYFDEQIANMRLGLKRGFSVPRATLAGRDESIAEVLKADDEKNLFYTPFKDMPAIIPADQQAKMRAEGLKLIRERVLPAYVKLLAFIRDVYIPQARNTLAAEAMPNGKAYYRAQILKFTTLDQDPDSIHALGVAEVAKIHEQMLRAMADSGFTGSFADFLHYLRTDPKFYPKTGAQLLERAAWIAKQVDGKVGRYIGLLPRNRFGIEPVPPDLAPFYTAGRGGPDTYLVNTYDLPSRPLYALTALTLHESSPGHSLQMSLAAEHEGMPDFRRYSYISAYGEGWALYSEYLGNEMGMYQDPYDLFGYLSYQMWRACRLVVDTGVHHLGWTRRQAQDYLLSNTALSEHEVETEVDRYIAWPGQALSYYLGMMDIEAARAKAQQALGAKFDLRAFHDVVLALGSVPLPVLDRRIERFIAEGGKSPYPPRSGEEGSPNK